MIAVSDAWKNIQYRFLLPETFVEIDCTITEASVQGEAEIFGENEEVFSNTASVLYDTTKTVKYATNELNLWALDGTMTITPDSAPYADAGYASSIDAKGSVTVKLPEVHSNPTSGVTITWSSRYDEYPSEFTITAKNGDDVVLEKVVTGNTSQVTAVFEQLQNYDSLTISVSDWDLPYRRVRIEKVVMGYVMTFTKKEIFGYTHEQNGHLNSGELPKNSIDFTLDNTDGKWNPSNPEGLEQYLSERQKIKVRYGLDVDGVVEWIKAGTFYLSEWRVPSNGLEASFVARDIFEYLLNETYTGRTTGTLYEFVVDAFRSAGVPDDFVYDISDVLRNYTAELPEDEHKCAEIIQMCANAASCVCYQDRDGVLHIIPFDKTLSDYTITSALSYSHPEVELSKPLKNVSVSYGDDRETYLISPPIGQSGEVQTVSNPLVSTETQASSVARWVADMLSTRQTVKGEYRADPRLDVFDVVTVESDKYGTLTPVAITNIKYSYSGSFKATYTGRVLGGN